MAPRVILAALLVAPALGAAICNFSVVPVFPGYFVDPTCKRGGLGCLADGKNVQCRFCGGGAYENVTCGYSACKFPNEPFVPYYWDKKCKMGELGCWADGVHAQCRFCGSAPFTSIDCPEYVSAPPKGAACEFNASSEPKTPYYWEPACKDGMVGCLADGINVGCRFCGEGAYASIKCPRVTRCTFSNEPTVPYYWDPDCKVGKLGCLADGVHPECRFCAARPFEDIPCPSSLNLPRDHCHWPKSNVPSTPFFWDETCEAGMLGCWADGLHAKCRFCGTGSYANVTCPEGVMRLFTENATEQAMAAAGEQHAAQAGVAMERAAGEETAEDIQTTTTAAKEVDVNSANIAGHSISVLLFALGVLGVRA